VGAHRACAPAGHQEEPRGQGLARYSKAELEAGLPGSLVTRPALMPAKVPM